MMLMRSKQAMFSAAMRGELGSLAQAVAKYQLERKLQKESDRLKKTKKKSNAVATPGNDDKNVISANCLFLSTAVQLCRYLSQKCENKM